MPGKKAESARSRLEAVLYMLRIGLGVTLDDPEVSDLDWWMAKGWADAKVRNLEQEAAERLERRVRETLKGLCPEETKSKRKEKV